MGNEISSVVLAIGIFLIGVISPGPNFLVVAQSSLSLGRTAGILTGLGVATGDAIYASVGFLGLSTFITQSGYVFGIIKMAGGAYLIWLGLQMFRDKQALEVKEYSISEVKKMRCYCLGLLTDLANPKTVIFFASIFVATHDPTHPLWVSIAKLVGIIVTSILWRISLATIFSGETFRQKYTALKVWIDRVFGSVLILLGFRFALSYDSSSLNSHC